MAGPPAVQVHPSALCESDTVGEGTRIWAFAHVTPGAVIGRDCNICDHAYVEGGAVLGDRVTVKNAVMVWHGVTVGDDVFLGPGMVFTNDLVPRSRSLQGERDWMVRTRVGNGVSLGAHVTVVCGIEVGDYAFAGAGSVLVRDVAPHALVVGNPARQIGWACVCGMRLTDDLSCQHCGRRFELSGPGELREIDPG
ncbi:MAG: UDP-2-acetamido-3-amino-2,3-dideoxy-glucuronate N-acetyltransferase [Actinomycetota bacterium]